MKDNELIGIVGGVGPYAGIDLVKKIFDQTRANTDQDHLSVALLSMPTQIIDRTAFVLEKTNVNPAYSVVEIIKRLKNLGASVVGIPCNTMHTPQIYDVLIQELRSENIDIKVVHMIYEVAKFIAKYYPDARKIGVLSTNGTYQSGIYKSIFNKMGLDIIMPNWVIQKNVVHNAIYDPEYGIKAQSNPVSKVARNLLFNGIYHLQSKGADIIVLGCTEVSLAITENMLNGSAIIDSTFVLARALIRELDASKLKPYLKEDIGYRGEEGKIVNLEKCFLEQ
ncbi:aspartate/glutamate racemase family protein [Ruminiclostridium cellobioparum]|jgi:aspartate racemase|uniref:aspartate/glutamate racemase family protein n=1 Tax=Ruminiclostridium cellobioparum TaxID=29355 RepID=UPI0028B191D9|nr:amino acid racemase [Ruminiclostridium cellobioparum]